MDVKGEEKKICYDAGTGGTALFAYLAPLSMLLLSAVVGYISYTLIIDDSLVSRICGICLALLFLGYAGYYYILFLKSRNHVTARAVLTNDYIEAEDRTGTKRFALGEIVFSMSYSSASTLCVIISTENDYMVLNCSSLLLLSRNGRKVLDPFYAINRGVMAVNPNHINYIHSRKSKNKKFAIPKFMFEADFHSARVGKFIDSLRAQYRFR